MDPDIHQMYMAYYLVAFWLETTIYGVYCLLFVMAMGILLKRRPSNATASRVFTIGIVTMFTIVTFHNWTNIYRMITAYAKADDPVEFLRDWNNWDAFAFPVIGALVTWLGDILVIYRCFLIWQRNYWIIVAPVVLILASVGVSFFSSKESLQANTQTGCSPRAPASSCTTAPITPATTSVNLFWFRHQSAIPLSTINPILKVTFPLNVAQNVLTTSFIAWKIYTRHRLSQQTGLFLSAGLDLMTILRIIVESAVLYTASMITVTVLFYLNHPGQVIVQHAAQPITGIVFVVIAVRTHLARGSSFIESSPFTNDDPLSRSWLSREEGPARPRSNRRSMPVITTTVEQYRMDVLPHRKGARDSETKADWDLDDRSMV